MVEIFDHVDLGDIEPGPQLDSVEDIIGVPVVVGYPGFVNPKLAAFKKPSKRYTAYDRKSCGVEFFFGFFTGKKTATDDTILYYSVDDGKHVWMKPDELTK